MRSLLRTIFYSIKVVHLTTLADMIIGFNDARSYNPSKTLQWLYIFPINSLIFDILFIFMNMQMRKEKFSLRPMTSIHLSYDITGSITKCHNDSLGLKLVYFYGF